jgi:hypothetical protein
MSVEGNAHTMVRTEGEVMIYESGNGWLRGYAGMALSEDVIVKTGRGGRAVIANGRGEFITVPPFSTKEIGADSDLQEVDTLRRIRLVALRPICVTELVPTL